jgi:DNA-binding MurR/RpiR family transcriptional regulator
VENALLEFMAVGNPCQFFRDLGVGQMSTATLGPNTLAIGISNSGCTNPSIDALYAAKDHGATTLCITSFPDNPIARVFDIKLFTPTIVGPTGGVQYHKTTESKISQLQVVGILYSFYAVQNFGTAMEGL